MERTQLAHLVSEREHRIVIGDVAGNTRRAVDLRLLEVYRHDTGRLAAEAIHAGASHSSSSTGDHEDAQM
jgi:hypothetical protein